MRYIPLLLDLWRQNRRNTVAKLPKHTLTQEELHEVAGKVRELSRGLTRNRDLAGERYFNSPGYLGAYLLYFWPISYAQTSILLGEAEDPIHSALDLGSGPGPGSLALLDRGAARVTAADRSKQSLDLARDIASAAGRRLETVPWDAEAGGDIPRGSFDLITLGHVLNELWADRPDRADLRFALIERITQSLAPGGRILIMEPALMSTAVDLLRLRDRLIESGLRVESPCTFTGPCPALPGATCHAEYDWDPPRPVRDIARRSRVSDRGSLKTAYILVSRGTVPGGSTAQSAASGPRATAPYRVVSDPMLSKSGRLRYFVCGPEGRFTLSAKKEGLPPAFRPFFTLRRGDLIVFEGTEERENGRGLTAASRIEVVRRRGGPRVKG
jgi:SAM-dependent methyltransferase